MEYHLFIPFFASLSRAAGFGFLKAKTWSLPPLVFRAYCFISDCLMGFYVFRIISRVFLPMTLPQGIEWISTLLYVGQVFVKSLMIRMNYDRLTACVAKMDAFFQMANKRDRAGFGEIWRKQYNVANKFCKVIFYSQQICLLLAYAPSFYNSIADPSASFMTFPSYYFFYDTHYGFKVGYLVLDFITSAFCTFKTSAIEMLYLTFVSYYIASLKYMKVELRKIFDDFSEGKFCKVTLHWWIETHKETLRWVFSRSSQYLFFFYNWDLIVFIYREVLLFKELVRNLLLVIYIYNLLNVVTMILFVTAVSYF